MEAKAVNRIRGEEASSNANKSRGSINKIISTYTSERENSTVNRCLGGSAQENRNKANGSMQHIMTQNGSNYQEKVTCKRPNENKQKSNVDFIFSKPKNIEPCKNESNYKYESSVRKHEQNKGNMGDIMHKSDSRPVPSNAPRVSNSGKDIAKLSAGTIKLGYSEKEINQAHSDLKQRVKPEAMDNQVKNAGCLTQQFYNYNKLKTQDVQKPRVKNEAKSNADQAKGTAQYLFTKYGKLPKDPKPKANVSGAGKRFMKKNKKTTIFK